MNVIDIEIHAGIIVNSLVQVMVIATV